ncbi:type IV pilus secretin PilQ [Limnobacter sp.]|uniref:type IV pilus secretin PilQ n=1 Tax=Limnobacter sp. TaxID=2003368 RepID=UPI003511E691
MIQTFFNNRRAWRALGVMVMLTVSSGAAQALSIVGGVVKDQADQSVLTLTLDEPLVARVPMFRMSGPDRHVLDFPVRLEGTNLDLNLPKGSRIRSAQLIHASGKSRLVIGLHGPYEVSQSLDGQQVKLVFSGPAPYLPSSILAARASADSALQHDIKNSLGGVVLQEQFARLQSVSVQQQGRSEIIRFSFDGAKLLADARLDGNTLTLRFGQAVASPEVLKSAALAGLSFASDPQLQSGDHTVSLRLNLRNATHTIRQSGGQVDLELQGRDAPLAVPRAFDTKSVKPLSPSESSAARYAGRPISLDFKNADIRTVMQVFADFTKMNLVLSDSVQGKVTVYLKDVPWDQALDIVMRSKGLVSSQSGNVLLVSTLADVMNDQLENAKRQAQDGLEPLVSRVFQVSYQKTADLVALIKADDAGLLSSRGTLIADERTSQIFVRDTPSRLERIEAIVTGLDKPVKQVLIEARVVLADTSVSKELGVRLRGSSARGEAFAEIGDQFGSGGFVDTGAGAAANFAYTLFNANSTRLINLQLRALETSNRIRTVSNPRVITSNKEAASIEQGTEIPYQMATSSGATAIEFKEANLKLDVTPQITPDGTVLLEVDVAKDSIGITTAAGPAIDTRRVKTKVLVADGGTVVLGGIFEEGDNLRDDKVPLLGDVPVVGHLFKGKTDNRRRAELLIFLTPVVLSSL